MKMTEQLKKLILEAPISRHRICKLAKVSTASMSSFISGNRGFSQEAIDALGEVLGITLTMDHAKLQRLAKDAPAPGRPVAKRNRKANAKGKR
ncbi:MAG: hypothetical protein FWD61_17770 [Phycisphaerales bacterium]|nr:hypothetical protein [Phycisphaerales bacterium]